MPLADASAMASWYSWGIDANSSALITTIDDEYVPMPGSIRYGVVVDNPKVGRFAIARAV